MPHSRINPDDAIVKSPFDLAKMPFLNPEGNTAQ